MGRELKRGFFLAFMVLLLCSASLCGAASLESINYPRKATIADFVDVDVEFMMDSEVSIRFLANNPQTISGKALDRGNSVCPGGGRCVPDPSSGNFHKDCKTYHRDCKNTDSPAYAP